MDIKIYIYICMYIYIYDYIWLYPYTVILRVINPLIGSFDYLYISGLATSGWRNGLVVLWSRMAVENHQLIMNTVEIFIYNITIQYLDTMLIYNIIIWYIYIYIKMICHVYHMYIYIYYSCMMCITYIYIYAYMHICIYIYIDI